MSNNGVNPMNQAAVSHRVNSPDVCVWDESTVTLRLRVAFGDAISASVVYAPKFHWHEQSARHTLPMCRLMNDGLFDWFGVTLRLSDDRLSYVFKMETREGVFYYSEEGVSDKYVFEQGFYNCFQLSAIHKEDIRLIPSWMSGATCYQIFPERFAQGGGDKSYVNMEWLDDPAPKSWAGGDLNGVADHMDYLADLGVSCLYLTPVFVSESNHKYDIQDYTRVDERFGGNDALRRLINAAHDRGIKVMLDGVFNHCSSKHPFFADVVKYGRQSRYYDWFYIRGDKPNEIEPNYKTFGDVPYMPRLNVEHPEVVKYFQEIGIYWIKEFGADGWRLDVCDELSCSFLRAFRRAVKDANPDALIIGEVWHDAAKWLAADQLDGVMNYGLTKALLDALCYGTINAEGLSNRLASLLTRNTDVSNAMALNLLGSHDTHRFLTLASGDTRKLAAAYAIMFFLPGMPCVYYGDEIGMEGGYDPGCRRCFDWDVSRWDNDLRGVVKELIELKKSPPLSSGSISIKAEGSIMSITRSCTNEEINENTNENTNEKITLSVNVSGSSVAAADTTLPPYGFTINRALQFSRDDVRRALPS